MKISNSGQTIWLHCFSSACPWVSRRKLRGFSKIVFISIACVVTMVSMSDPLCVASVSSELINSDWTVSEAFGATPIHFPGLELHLFDLCSFPPYCSVLWQIILLLAVFVRAICPIFTPIWLLLVGRGVDARISCARKLKFFGLLRESPALILSLYPRKSNWCVQVSHRERCVYLAYFF